MVLIPFFITGVTANPSPEPSELSEVVPNSSPNTQVSPVTRARPTPKKKVKVRTVLVKEVDKSEWRKWGLRLTGESQKVRNKAISKLKRIPDLAELLRFELEGKDYHQALDIITVLNIKELLPDLIRLSIYDDSGHFYLTLNTFTSNRSVLSRIKKIYVSRLNDARGLGLAPVVQMILLDTLGRAGVRLPLKSVLYFLEAEHYEIKSAAVYYARLHLLRKKPAVKFIPVLKRAMNLEPFQLRVQTYYTISELPDKIRIQLMGKKECKDEFKSVISACKKALKGSG